MEKNEKTMRTRLFEQPMRHVLISIKPRYVDQIINGEKLVEIRRRRVLFEPGTVIWIYATRPRASIVGFAIVRRVDTDDADRIWSRSAKEIAISKRVYREYVAGAPIVSAIHLSHVNELDDAVSLEEIRLIVRGFNPPQFFHYLHGQSMLRRTLEAHIIK